MKRLDGKVAIITGSGSGMGKAAALLFAREGAKVAVVDINDKGGAEVVEAIKKAGGEAIFLHVDVGVEADLKRMVEQAVKAFGKVNIFWHNAGIAGTGIIERTTEKDFDRQIAIHVKGGYFGAKYVIPEMKKAGGGAMLFTSSISGIKPSAGSPSYSIAKAGLQILAQCIALGYAKDNIRANAVCPGAVDTPLWPAFVSRDPDLIPPAELEKRYLSKMLIGRKLRPEEIAQTALFLCSDEASAITGAILPVDGGMALA